MTKSSDESLVTLVRALDQTTSAIADVRGDQLAWPTPCGEWDVATLISHLLDDMANFTRAAEGQDPDWAARPGPLPDDWRTAFSDANDQLVETWRQTSEAGIPPDMATAEFAVHTWDLVRATGQDLRLDPHVAERALGFISTGLTPGTRGDAFAPEVDVADDAPIHDRLAAFAGRDPGYVRRART
jgi:uncharacterized protein (TIGR03086 family)